jgi:RNase adapter protein RapZ
MKLIIVSGLSGSGKTIALNTLEDCGFFCVDNLPFALLEEFVEQVMLGDKKNYAKTAIGIDARNQSGELVQFAKRLDFIKSKGIQCDVLYLQAEENVLLKRYSETRRRHPLTDQNIPLKEALRIEKDMLRPVAKLANVIVDTSHTHYHQLRELLKSQLGEGNERHMVIQFLSFGFKHGIPLETDFMFDARSLPNPYWVAELRGQTGKDQPVIDFLSKQEVVQEYFQDVRNFIERWAPRFEADNRSYLTVAIGCTGGQHRSVFLVDQLVMHFQQAMHNTIVRHRELH